MITRDLQMAGYYTNFDRNNRQLDWNDLDGDSNPANNMETGRPLIFAVNNVRQPPATASKTTPTSSSLGRPEAEGRCPDCRRRSVREV